jgi:hypothetical protein
MKEILVLVFSNYKQDARVQRQVNVLKKNNRVTLVCFAADDDPDLEIIRIQQTRLTTSRRILLGLALISRRYQSAYAIFHNYGFLIDQLSTRNFDLIMANDVDTLPLAFALKKNARIIFDAHEYAPRHFENNLVWRIFFQPFNVYICRKYIPLTDAMLTVGKGLALEYEKNFGAKPVIITNAQRYYPDVPPSALLPGRLRLIHHGIANPSRRLELMIEMMEHLDERFTLDMILLTSDYASGKTKTFIENLKISAAKNPRIRILPPLRSHEIVPTITNYDVGVFLLPPVNFNYENTLPNKLFDFIQARLAIAIGPSPEMAAIVKDYNIGIVSEDFTPKALADKLNALDTETLTTLKANTTRAAAELNAERNAGIFGALVDDVLNR